MIGRNLSQAQFSINPFLDTLLGKNHLGVPSKDVRALLLANLGSLWRDSKDPFCTTIRRARSRPDAREPSGSYASLIPITSPETIISTRRFSLRPAAVALSAIGLS